jgi:uncharacterized protein (TIGR00369 family)
VGSNNKKWQDRLNRESLATMVHMANLDPSMAAAVKDKFKSIPISGTLGLSLEALGPGEAKMTMSHDCSYHGIYDSMHGGLLMTLADTCACVAILTMTGPDAVITTTDMNIRFLAPCLTDATAEAKIIKFGRSLVPVNVVMRDKGGREVALAQVTYMRLEKMPSR